jgi:methylisocitrate lyase
VKVPVLANITEFGSTPLYTVDELRSADVSMVLYPLSAFRAMNQAALNVYQRCAATAPRRTSSTLMQTRMDLVRFLDYHDFEQTSSTHCFRKGA